MSIVINLPDFTSELIAKKDVSIIPKTSQGIYFLYDNNESLIYVGKSKNLRQRVATHFNGTSSSKSAKNNTAEFSHMFEYVRYIDVPCEYERDMYETYAINTMMPKMNSAKTFLYQSDYLEFIRSVPPTSEEIQLERSFAETMEGFRLW